jgi:cutinase
MRIMGRLPIAGLLAAAGVLSSLTVIGGSRPAAASPCPDVEVIFARGTNEPPGVGGIGQPFLDSLRARVDARRSGAAYAVNYPASDDFANSIAAGVGDASAHVQATAANCPQTLMVLGGYSQGAAVMDKITESLPPATADHIAAVALFGNPKGALADSFSMGSLTIGPLYAPKTIDLCVPGDPICSEGTDFFAHLLYVQAGMTDQAASFVASRVQ